MESHLYQEIVNLHLQLELTNKELELKTLINKQDNQFTYNLTLVLTGSVIAILITAQFF